MSQCQVSVISINRVRVDPGVSDFEISRPEKSPEVGNRPEFWKVGISDLCVLEFQYFSYIM